MSLVNAALITLTFISADPALSGDYGEAADHARRALMQTEAAKQTMKTLENRGLHIAEEYLGLSKDDWIYFTWTVPLSTGKISTKPFKNFKTMMLGGTLRPEIEYKFTGDQEFNSMLLYQMEF